MKVLVCGSRFFKDKKYLFLTLDRIHSIRKITAIIEGDAKGADMLAGEWATENNIELMEFPANWDLYGKAAGFRRNIEMLNQEPNLVVGFDPGNGTSHTLKEAVRRNIRIIVLGDQKVITDNWMKENGLTYKLFY